MRLIDADALLEQLSKKDSEVHIGLVMQLIDSMPTVQREPANEGYPLIRLGYGLVEVGIGDVEGEPVVIFTNHGTGVIGEKTVEEPRVNDPKDVYAAISIGNIDSLNVVRKQLDIFASKYLDEVAPTIQREGWVSVDDRLPDIENKTLLCTDANNLKGYLATDDIFGAVFYKGKWYLEADSDYPHEIKVTYWQYLPAAPTETE